MEIDGLCIDFETPEGTARAVEDVTFHIDAGETLGLVGESGCGKSVTSLSTLGLIPSPPGRIRHGRIHFNDQDLLALDDEGLRKIRGRDIAMIFQEPMTSLNPVLTIGHQVAEPLMVHQRLAKSDAMQQARQWLEFVKIPAASKRLHDFPHQLSGGMRQRVMIAMALVCRPKLLIADEPTTAVDVTIQSQILSLMLGLKEELNMSILLITHDLGVIAQMAGRVIVMYAGQIVEQAPVTTIFDRPFHPYTQGLMQSMPQLGSRGKGHKKRLVEIAGSVPPLTETINGCKFASRCPHTFGICQEKRPLFFPIAENHQARCWLKELPLKRS